MKALRSSSNRFVPLALAVLLVAAPAAFAGLPDIIPRDVLFGNPEKIAPQISPDGKFLAYVAPDRGVLNVWVRTIGKTDDRVVTRDRDRGIRWFLWAYNNKDLLFVQDKTGKANWHLFGVDMTTKKVRDLTPYPGIQARNVMMDPNFANEILVALNVDNPQFHDVYRVNLTSNTCTKEVTNPGDIVDWFTDTKFKVRGALATTLEGGFQLKVRDNVASAWRPLTTWKTQDAMNSHAIGFAPGDKSIYAVSSIGANTSRFVEIPLATGTEKVLASNRKVDVNKIMIHPKRHQIQAVSFLKDRSDVWEILDSDVKKDFKTIKKLQEGSFEIVSRDLADKTWLVKFDSDRSPGQYFTYNRQSKEGKTLFTTRPKLRNYTLAKMKPVTFSSRDGLDLHSFLTLPVGVEAKKLPAVILVRHGAWAQDTWGFDPTVQWLANRGYAVLQINFRGSSGFGKNFTNAGDREWGGKMHDDLIDGVNWLTDKGYADKNKIAIFGGGIYGGYAALVGLSFTPNVFACGVDMVGISNLVTWMKNFPPYWEPYRALVAQRIGDPNDTSFLTARSPFFKADRITKPLIIAQGAKDQYIKRTESDQIVAALKTTGVPVEYKIFEDEGHLLRKPENRLAFYAAAETFLAKHIGGRQQR